MKKTTVITGVAGLALGAVAGVGVCTTEWGQKNILGPAVCGKKYIESKIKSNEDEDDDDDDEVVEDTAENEHVEKD